MIKKEIAPDQEGNLKQGVCTTPTLNQPLNSNPVQAVIKARMKNRLYYRANLPRRLFPHHKTCVFFDAKLDGETILLIPRQVRTNE